ncbi:flagellar hook-length control protein FliK [Roseicella frigidaeris]|uniref:flagellar hook-length control protein FliK n=1 Tax=Roseicella frigidaeris TaxID=2230885 RepID=UPI00140269B9|nr:flagellar hook-length control protein FliK [Roseicella frigidaeris]
MSDGVETRERPAGTPSHPAPSPATAQPVPDAAFAPAGPAPTAAPAEAAAPVAAQPRPALPPVRQLAPVAVALALGPGTRPSLTVALDPEALGRVEIRIAREAGSEAAAIQVVAERPETLALLQRDARELDRALGQAGITLAEGGLRFDLAGGDASAGGRGEERRPSGGQAQAAPDAGPDAPMPAAGAAPRPLSLTLLDIAV